MKKIFSIFVLVFSLVSAGLANDSKKPSTTQENGFKIKPKLFWATITPFIVRSDHTLGINVFGLDASLLKYKNFHFLAVGGGLQTYYKQVLGWHVAYDYGDYPQYYYGYGYKFFFEPYLKFVPIKYRWNWASKILKVNSYLELGITHKKDIVFGLTFSGNPFQKKKIEKED